jgi:glucarate dehydratase
VVDLLGGAVRGRVEFAAYLFFKPAGAGGDLGYGVDPAAGGWLAARQAAAMDPEGIVAQARAMCDHYGFRTLKLKGGALPPETEVASVMALREAFGDGHPLRFDPNAIWREETAIRWGTKMAGVLQYYEDPVRGQEAMARVRARLDVPMATNMCTTAFEHLPGSIGLGSEDVILADHHGWGGLRPSLELAAICRTFGRGLSMHSNTHLGISLAAMVHLAAAAPNLTFASDTHAPWQSEDVVTRPWRFEGGSLEVPTEPGLGVELDGEALERLHARYLECGLQRRDDEAEMQKIEPGWRYASPRW